MPIDILRFMFNRMIKNTKDYKMQYLGIDRLYAVKWHLRASRLGVSDKR
jgi:hypothetical protein